MLFTFVCSFQFVFIELQQQKTPHSPFLNKEQEAVCFCDQLLSNTVVLNCSDAERVLCLWVERLTVLTPDKLSQLLHFTNQHLLPCHVKTCPGCATVLSGEYCSKMTLAQTTSLTD